MTTPTTNTFEQALAHAGSLLAAWEALHRAKSGETNLRIYALQGQTLDLLFEEFGLDEARIRTRVDGLRGRGARMATFDGTGRYVWAGDADRFSLWATDEARPGKPTERGGLILDGDASGLRFADGSQLLVDQVRAVVACINSSLARREVRLHLADGSLRTIAKEERENLEWIPTYGWEDVVVDAAWVRALAMRLADWLKVPLEGPLGNRDPLDHVSGPKGGWDSLDDAP